MVAVTEAMLVVCLAAKVESRDKTIELMQENIDLREQITGMQDLYRVQVVKLCKLQNRYGEAYRAVLVQLVDDLGLDRRPKSAASVLLRELGNGVGGE